MPNQMIALQARAPQTDILGSSIARSAQMINMMRQQDAAERQALSAAQAAQIAAAQELRAAAKEGRDIQEAKIKLVSDAGKIFRDSLASWVPFGDTAAAQRLRDMTVALVPELKDVIPTAEALSTDRNLYNQAYMTAEQLANKRFGTATTSTQIDPRTNKIMAVNAAGLPEASFAQPVPDISQPLSGGAPTPGGAAPAGGLRPTRGVNTTPADLKAQMAPVTPDRIEAAAQAAARGARATDPIFDGLNDDQFRQMQMRADEIRAGGASMKPASFGGAAQPDLGAIVENMMQTGVVSQTDFEAMRAAAPGKDTQLAEILRANNIRIMPDETAAGGMRSAVYRPEEGVPAMLEAQYNPNAYETAQGKNPMQGPLPGSAQVPIPRVREEAKAQRKTPQETYEETRSTKQAESDVKFLEGVGAARESAQQALSVINDMIGDARLNKNGQITIKPGGRAPHPGFEDVIGATWRPGARFIPGTNAAGFDAYLEQVEGGAFLEAYERLKGTGQITEVEGQKATRAITRMKRSVSEPEFVKAAREFEGIIRSALDRASQREAKLRGAPAAGAGRRTPVPNRKTEFRYNPATGDFD